MSSYLADFFFSNNCLIHNSITDLASPQYFCPFISAPIRNQPVPCCPPFSAPCYHFEETEPVAFLFRKCCLPCLGLLYKKETQLNMASPDQKRAVGTGAQQTECVPGRRGTRRPLACSSGWPGCPWSPPSQKMEERWADLQMLPGSQAPWGGHQAGAVLARRLIRLVFRSWSRIFFSISASVRVSSSGHH